LYSPEGVLEALMHYLNSHPIDIILGLSAVMSLNMAFAIRLLVGGARIRKEIEWLDRARRRVGGASERRFLIEMQNKPVARLLLEGPKPIRLDDDQRGADLDNSDAEKVAKQG
jgi:hypothetical protein